MLTALAVLPPGPEPLSLPPFAGCAWWNLVCQGGSKLADSGMNAITQSIASGASMLLGEITKVIDESTTVPLADSTYRSIYFGFLGLAVPMVGVVLFGALVVACVRRDPGTFVRAVTGVLVATIGGALYIAFAQFIIALDDWLSHGIVSVTGHSLTDGITGLAEGFEQIGGASGEVAANMLLIVLMMVMLVAGLGLWFVLVLRKIAILVVVAFAPLLIVGWLWAPTRSWMRRTTEVVIALIFTKSALFALFGIGLALLFRDGGQSLSDFVGAVILLCGACFAPLMMLKLVHFAADSHVAGEMMGTLRGGMAPVLNRVPHPSTASKPMSRFEMARQYSNGSPPEPVKAGPISPGTTGESAPAPQPATAGGSVGKAGGGGSAAGGVAGGVGTGVLIAEEKTRATAEQVTTKAGRGAGALAVATNSPARIDNHSTTQDERLEGPPMPGQHSRDKGADS